MRTATSGYTPVVLYTRYRCTLHPQPYIASETGVHFQVKVKGVFGIFICTYQWATKISVLKGA